METKNHIEEWKKFAGKHQDGIEKVKNIRYAWPVGAPLKECQADPNLIDKSLLQPMDQTWEKILKEQRQRQVTGMGYQSFPTDQTADTYGKRLFNTFTDAFTVQDLREADAFMLLGKTGSGKTTLINALASHLWGVKWDDSDRFAVIHDEKQQIREAGHSQNVGAS